MEELRHKCNELESQLDSVKAERDQLANLIAERDRKHDEAMTDALNTINQLRSQVEEKHLMQDPAAILNRLRRECRSSKTTLKDVELIIELIQASA